MGEIIEVLIAEDDVRIAKIHEKFLEQVGGYKTIGMAHTVEEAKMWLETLQPDLILLDIYFPDDLGTSVIDFIKEKKLKTDIILITAAAEVEIVKKAYSSGVVDFLLKPITLQKFQESLLKYKEKEAILKSNTHLKPEQIQRLWNRYPTQEEDREKNPKGIDTVTKTKIIEFITTYEGGITAEKLGAELGISRTTARRYLEHLMEEKVIYVEHIYGSVGRPERRYFIQYQT